MAHALLNLKNSSWLKFFSFLKLLKFSIFLDIFVPNWTKFGQSDYSLFLITIWIGMHFVQ